MDKDDILEMSNDIAYEIERKILLSRLTPEEKCYLFSELIDQLSFLKEEEEE